MKRLKILSLGFLSLCLVCGTLAAWEMEGQLVEIDLDWFRPYDIETLPDGSTWLTYFDTGFDHGRLMRFDYMKGSKETNTFSEPARFQTLDAADDNTLWIADAYDRIVHYDPATHTFTGYPLDPAVFDLPAQPFGITVGPDDHIWFTCWQDRCLGRFDPVTETFERLGPPLPAEMDSTPVEIAFDGYNDAWITMRGPVGPPGIRKYDVTSGLFFVFAPDPDLKAPFGIISRLGKMWFLDHSANLLVNIHTTSYEMEKIPIPPELEDAHFLVMDVNKVLWFTAYASGAIGTYDPKTGIFDHIHLEDELAKPMGIALSPNGRVCWAETYNPEHGGVGFFFIDPQSGLFSPRTHMTYNNMYIEDAHLWLAYMNLNGIPFDPHDWWLRIPTLNAADEATDPVTGYRFPVFSVRENQMLFGYESGFVYAKKNDLIRMRMGNFEIFFTGSDFNVPGIDAVTVLEDGRIIFSSDDDFFYDGYPNPPAYFHDEDLLVYDPSTGELRLFFPGHMVGITSLDAVEIFGGWLYFSVKDPVYVNVGPVPFYAEDGDVLGFNIYGAGYELKFKGSSIGLHDLDALSLLPFRPTFGSGTTAGIGGPVKGK